MLIISAMLRNRRSLEIGTAKSQIYPTGATGQDRPPLLPDLPHSYHVGCDDRSPP